MSETERARPPVLGSSGRTRDAGVVTLLISLSLLLFFYRLGSLTLFDADEPAFAESAREMLLSGNWVTPQFNFQPRYDKPILFYWLIGLAYKGFGVGEFAARFWSAAFATGLVLSIYLFGRQMLGRRAAVIAALGFATNVGTAILARAAVTDMTLTFFMTVTLFCFFAVCRAPDRIGEGPLFAGYLAMALSVLTKGPIGLLIPGLVVGLFGVIRGRGWKTISRLRPVTGLLLFAVVALPWYLLVLRENGWDFIQGFFLKHHLIRYFGVVSSNSGSPFYFLPVVVLAFFPWTGLLPKAFGDLWRIRGRLRGELTGRGELLLFLWLWFGVIFAFFSLSGTKLPSYIFPALPALALLSGAAGEALLDEGTEAGGMGRAFDWLVGGIACSLSLGLFLLPLFIVDVRPRIHLGLAPYVLAVLFLLGPALAVYARRKGQGNVTLAAMVATMVLSIVVAVHRVAPAVQERHQKVLRDLADAAGRQLGPNDLLVAYDLNAPSLVFYARRQVAKVGKCQEERFRQLAASWDRVLVIARASAEPRLREVQGIFPLDRRGRYVLYSSRHGPSDRVGMRGGTRDCRKDTLASPS